MLFVLSKTIKCWQEDKSGNYWIKATALVKNYEQRFYYNACSNCKKGTTFPINKRFTCQNCKTEKKKSKVVPWYVLRIEFFNRWTQKMKQFLSHACKYFVGYVFSSFCWMVKRSSKLRALVTLLKRSFHARLHKYPTFWSS